MPIPAPERGLVIPYAYLWRHERGRGIEEGQKIRPAVIVLAVDGAEAGQPLVTVVPVTHTAQSVEEGIELPPRVKQALGLDEERSWVVLTEYNQFTWPGFDLRPVTGTTDQFAYGFLPPALFARITAQLLRLIETRRVRPVDRN